jgi:hypothetical protein
MTSIPAMFDVQGPSETNFNVQPNTAAMFANQTMMQPIMLMSPQPPGCTPLVWVSLLDIENFQER